jgi:hypothetical protein
MGMYVLGIITGLIISLIVIVITLWQKPKVERLFNQTQSALKEKGKIIEPKESLEEWLDNLKEE